MSAKTRPKPKQKNIEVKTNGRKSHYYRSSGYHGVQIVYTETFYVYTQPDLQANKKVLK
jgi:hypothetical protein